MGLDMTLYGETFYWTNWNNDPDHVKVPDLHPELEGYKAQTVRYEVGYWRKHPDLHGYIVNTFANGEDDCQDIYLDREDIEKLIEVVKQGKEHFEKTEGFFFGNSEDFGYYEPDEIEATVKQFENALAFIDKHKTMKGASPSIYYRASW